MTTIRTGTDLTTSDIRRFERHGYEILTVETRRIEESEHDTIIWGREDKLGIAERDLPF